LETEVEPSVKRPDHVVHPERWKKYSLEDVEIDDQAGERQAALTFLTELKERKAAAKQRENQPSNEQAANGDHENAKKQKGVGGGGGSFGSLRLMEPCEPGVRDTNPQKEFKQLPTSHLKLAHLTDSKPEGEEQNGFRIEDKDENKKTEENHNAFKVNEPQQRLGKLNRKKPLAAALRKSNKAFWEEDSAKIKHQEEKEKKKRKKPTVKFADMDDDENDNNDDNVNVNVNDGVREDNREDAGGKGDTEMQDVMIDND